jgi:hypothetical protein
MYLSVYTFLSVTIRVVMFSYVILYTYYTTEYPLWLSCVGVFLAHTMFSLFMSVGAYIEDYYARRGAK